MWDNFIAQSNNGTIFHQRKFLSYHRERTFKDCSLMFVEKTIICAVFTGAVINNCLYSHPGASFGGFVYNQLSFKVANQIVVALTIEAVGEALVFASKAGADPSKVRQALMGGLAQSRILEVHGERMIKQIAKKVNTQRKQRKTANNGERIKNNKKKTTTKTNITKTKNKKQQTKNKNVKYANQ